MHAIVVVKEGHEVMEVEGLLNYDRYQVTISICIQITDLAAVEACHPGERRVLNQRLQLAALLGDHQRYNMDRPVISLGALLSAVGTTYISTR